jgi:hypothetical protein
LSFHSLRASYATAMAQKGAKLRDIAERLGHKSDRTTTSYIRPELQLLKAPAASSCSKLLQGACDPVRLGVEVEHRRVQVVVPKHHLHVADVSAAMEGMSGIRVAQQVRRESA